MNSPEICLYVSIVNLIDNDGYDKKTLDQMLAFRSFGWDASLVCFSGASVITAKAGKTNLDVTNSCFSTSTVFIRRIMLVCCALAFIGKNRPRLLYIRYPRADPICAIFLFVTSVISSNLKIIYEIPTYPFEKEMDKRIQLRPILLMLGEKIFRPIVSRIISAYSVVAFKEEAFNKRSIHIENGVSENRRKKVSPAWSNKKWNLIFVANFNENNRRHGLDRIISGLRNFSNTNFAERHEVTIHLVGDADRSKTMFSSLDQEFLSRFVKFYGRLRYQELSDLYDEMHVGIGCLAFHRIGVSHTSALKEREYLSFGLPLVSSSDDYLLGDQFPYRLRVPSDDSPVCIKSILEFAEKCYRNAGKEEIYQYSITHANWTVAMRGIEQFVNG